MNPRGIRLLVIEALKNKTDAGDRVYSPRDWPTTADMYPVILVQTPIDVKSSLGRNVPQFNTVTTVRLTGRLGFYTIGDPSIYVYDRSKDEKIDAHQDRNGREFCHSVDALNAGFCDLDFPAAVHSTAG